MAFSTTSSRPVRPLTVDDLASAKLSMLEELQLIGMQAAERLRMHLSRAELLHQAGIAGTYAPNRLEPTYPAQYASASPAPSTLCYATPGKVHVKAKPNTSASSTSQESVYRMSVHAQGPLLTSESLEAIFYQRLAHDAYLPCRWQQELERRLQAHTPSPGTTPLHRTEANSPASSCPTSPLQQSTGHGSSGCSSRLAACVAASAAVPSMLASAPGAAAIPTGDEEEEAVVVLQGDQDLEDNDILATIALLYKPSKATASAPAAAAGSNLNNACSSSPRSSDGGSSDGSGGDPGCLPAPSPPGSSASSPTSSSHCGSAQPASPWLSSPSASTGTSNSSSEVSFESYDAAPACRTATSTQELPYSLSSGFSSCTLSSG